MLGNRQEEITHHVTNLWTLVNKTRVDRSLTELELIKEQSRQNWREYESTIWELQHEQLSS